MNVNNIRIRPVHNGYLVDVEFNGEMSENEMGLVYPESETYVFTTEARLKKWFKSFFTTKETV